MPIYKEGANSFPIGTPEFRYVLPIVEERGKGEGGWIEGYTPIGDIGRTRQMIKLMIVEESFFAQFGKPRFSYCMKVPVSAPEFTPIVEYSINYKKAIDIVHGDSRYVEEVKEFLGISDEELKGLISSIKDRARPKLRGMVLGDDDDELEKLARLISYILALDKYDA